jgi:hypothetical protein
MLTPRVQTGANLGKGGRCKREAVQHLETPCGGYNRAGLCGWVKRVEYVPTGERFRQRYIIHFLLREP